MYFDIYSYSDIAIGSAYLLGVRLPRNFATPFLAASIQQLWQRWNITLTMFLRDYLFFFFQAEDGIRDIGVTGVQTCALPICSKRLGQWMDWGNDYFTFSDTNIEY